MTIQMLIFWSELAFEKMRLWKHFGEILIKIVKQI